MSELDRGSSGVARRADYLQIPLTQSTEADSWLVTYLDVITLLLVMFVVMLALSGGPGELPGENAVAAAAPAPVAKLSDAPESPVLVDDAFTERARAMLQAAGLADDITVISQQGGVRFRISNDILYGSGEAVLSREGIRQLENLVPLLASSDYRSWPHRQPADSH